MVQTQHILSVVAVIGSLTIHNLVASQLGFSFWITGVRGKPHFLATDLRKPLRGHDLAVIWGNEGVEILALTSSPHLQSLSITSQSYFSHWLQCICADEICISSRWWRGGIRRPTFFLTSGSFPYLFFPYHLCISLESLLKAMCWLTMETDLKKK